MSRRLFAPLREALRRASWHTVQAVVFVLWPLLQLIDAQVSRRRRRNRPRRIILVRHGESEGNVDRSLYATTPDSLISLTDRGFRQGKAAGEQIRELIGDESARFFHSPYMRTRQTMLAILDAFGGSKVQLVSEPRLREQDFGNFQTPKDMEKVYADRQKFGRFYYRFPNGEAGTDVYDRVSEFWSTLYRFMDVPGRTASDRPVQNYVLVTHGLLMRIFCMCYFRWTVAEFEQVWNPSNGETWVLEKVPCGRYRLAGRWREGEFASIKFGNNKSQPLYEHMRQPLRERELVPGVEGALSADALAHLRVCERPSFATDGVDDWHS